MFYDDDLPAPPGGFIDPPQLFPIQRQQNANVVNVHYSPLEYKIFKDLKAAVVQYGPQSPFVLAILKSLGKRQTNHSVKLKIYCPNCLGGFSMVTTS